MPDSAPPVPPEGSTRCEPADLNSLTGTVGFWRSRNVVLLLTARSLSVAGDWLFAIAIVWLVLQTTRSAGMVAAVSIAQAIPFVIFGVFFAGALDRVRSRQRTLVLLDLARAVIVLAFPLLDAAGALTKATLVLVSAVMGAATAVFTPGLQALLPDVLATSDLPRAHAMLDVTQRVGRILGPGLSGLLLLVVSTGGFFYIDSVSCLVSAVGVASLRVRVRRTTPNPEDRPPGRRWSLQELRASAAYLGDHPVSRRLILMRTMQNTLWAVYTVGLPLLVYQTLGLTAGVFGALIGVYAVGQLIGNALAVRLRGYAHPLRSLHAGWIICGAGYVAVIFSHAPVLVGAALAVSGIGSAAANIAGDGYLAVTTNPAMQGRIFTLQSTGMTLAQILGTAVFGALLAATPPGNGFMFAGLAMIATVAISAVRRPAVTPR